MSNLHSRDSHVPLADPGHSSSGPSGFFSRTGKLIDNISMVSGQISGILMTIACVIIIFKVAMREIFSIQIDWEYEIVIYMMMWFISLAFSFTQKQKGNIEVDLLISRFSVKRRETLTVAIYFLSIIFSVIFAYYAFFLFYNSFRFQETGFYVLSVIIWPVKLAFFVGTVLLTIQLIRMFVSQCHLLHHRSLENPAEFRKNFWSTVPVFLVLLIITLVLVNTNPLLGILLLMAVLLLGGVPIGFSLGLVGAGGLYFLLGGERALAAITIQAYSHLNSYIFIALPLYVFAGQLMSAGKLAENFYRVGSAFLGHLPGGLGIATIAACALFAAINGSSAATAATIGLIAIPELAKYGYSKKLACSLVAAGGTLGILIPPSNSMILIGAITGESVGKLFMAGLLPGILLALMFAITVALMAKAEHSPSMPKASWKERGIALKESFWVMLLPVVILVPIYTGLLTVTESAALAALYALVVSLARRTIKLKDLYRVLGEATTTTGMVFIIIVGALVLGFFVTKIQAPQQLLEVILASQMPLWLFIVVIMFILFIMGMFLEGVSITMIVIPILMLPLKELGVSMIWFAVLFTMAMEMAMMSPPVALNLFIVQKIGQAPMAEVLRGLWVFMVVLLIAILVVAFVPWLSEFIPSTM